MLGYKGVKKDVKGYFSGFDEGIRYEIGTTYEKDFELCECHGDGFYFGNFECAMDWAKKYQGVVLEVDVEGILDERAKRLTVLKEVC
jgi:hypothetical protein